MKFHGDLSKHIVEATISIEKLKRALESLVWADVKSLLDGAGGASAIQPTSIAEALRRSGALILKHPSPNEKKRNKLLEALERYLTDGPPSGDTLKRVREVIQTLYIAENGYRRLVAELSKAPASKLEAVIHVAAAIRLAEDELDRLFERIRLQFGQRQAITLQADLIGEDGTAISIDGAYEGIVSFVTMTLQMEAFKNKWIDAQGIVVIPAIPEVSDDAVAAASTTLFLAMLWSRWQSTEERARLFGRRLQLLKDEELSASLDSKTVALVIDEGDRSHEWLHRIAMERFNDKSAQNLIESKSAFAQGRQVGIPFLPAGWHALPPYEVLSGEESQAIFALSESLGWDVQDDPERYAGLRLTEWVRGYGALTALAERAQPSDLLRTRIGWQDYLAKFGIVADSAKAFISALSFRQSSRDLFDHPFIRIADGSYRLFSPALRTLNIHRVVLSTLGQLNVMFERKGKRFELAIQNVFEEAGLKAYVLAPIQN